MSPNSWRSAVLVVLGAALLGGCAGDERLLEPDREPVGGELFERYIALGNSITAGFQSLGINDSTQRESYPYLLAQQAGAPFALPLLNRPGCPPPMSAPFSTTTIAGTPVGAAVCFLRASPAQRLINNLAVPGAQILDAVDHTANANPGDTFNRLQTFILGGRSQTQAMIEADPTFVSAFLGSGDALGAALNGDVALLTPVASFEESLNEVVAAIASTDTRGAVLIGAVNTNVVPALQPGLFYWAVRQNPQTAPLLPKPVNDNCAPIGPLGQPNPLASNMISYTILFDAAVPEISCAEEAPFVLTAAEQAEISSRVAAYNSLIEAAANDHGWIYLDPNALLTPALADPALLRKCQGLATARTIEEITAAVLGTCPNPDPRVGFGSYMSFDGFHPSAEAHRVLAQALIEAINAEMGVSIPAL